MKFHLFFKITGGINMTSPQKAINNSGSDKPLIAIDKKIKYVVSSKAI